MHLSIHPITVLVHKLQSVSSVTVHESVTIRNTTITHENHDLMNGFGVLREVVPELGRVIAATQVGSRIPLLGVDEVREFGGIAQEEDGSVVCYHVPVALFSSELDRETSRVSGTVGGAGFATDGGEANGDWALFAFFAEDVGNAEVVQWLGALEGPMSTAALGVDDSLGNAFTVEMGEKVDQMEVLKKQWTVGTDTLGLVWMGHRDAIAGCVEDLLGRSIAVVFVASEDASSGRIGGFTCLSRHDVCMIVFSRAAEWK